MQKKIEMLIEQTDFLLEKQKAKRKTKDGKAQEVVPPAPPYLAFGAKRIWGEWGQHAPALFSL